MNLHEYFVRGWVGKPREVAIPKQFHDTTVDELEDRLEKTIALNVPGKPFGVMLSGGLDSSLIATILIRNDIKFECFCAGDECEWAARFLDGRRKLNLIMPTVEESLAVIEQNQFPDGPMQFNSAPSIYGICKLAKQRGIETLISGEGGDELFWGYPRYRMGLEGIGRVAKQPIIWYGSGLYTEHLVHALIPAHYPSLSESWHWLKDHQDLPYALLVTLFDQTWRLPQLITQRNQRMADLHGIKIVYPFIDPEFTKYANSLKFEYKFQGGRQRWIQSELAHKILPQQIATRPKQAFDSDLSYWITSDTCKEMVTRMHFPEFNKDVIRFILDNGYHVLRQKLWYYGMWRAKFPRSQIPVEDVEVNG